MRVVVVGAGIVGLAVAARLAARGDEVVVVDKEHDLAAHQTGRNSGVIHSGLYYAPGSLKARLGAAGAASMTAFAHEHGVAVDTCGKLVVATSPQELPRLATLAERGRANGVGLREVSPEEAREIEPHVAAVRALHVPGTGIVDYRGVCAVLAKQVEGAGGTLRLGTRFVAAVTRGARVEVTLLSDGGARVAEADGHGSGNGVAHADGGNGVAHDGGAAPVTNARAHGDGVHRGDRSGVGPQGDREVLVADALVTCAGLYADRAAQACGVDPGVRIVPFRGEYFELAPERADLVRGLIYPVPDPRFPFLGVHLTKMIHGGVHAGPNAVLAGAREGYRWRDVVPGDVADWLAWPGLWRLGARNLVPGAQEVVRSMSRRLFARSLARLVPGIGPDDLVPAPAGVRAQALARDGSLVQDFHVVTAPRQVHVINAPSPAATAALEIARYLEKQLDETLTAQSDLHDPHDPPR